MCYVTQRTFRTCQNETEHLPWSLKSQVSLVLDLDPMIAGAVDAVDAEVANKIQPDNMVSRSLRVTNR